VIKISDYNHYDLYRPTLFKTCKISEVVSASAMHTANNILHSVATGHSLQSQQSSQFIYCFVACN